ncbi:hypothetical protein [Yeosuana marina]|uniref:hypothetical protein n=1 Tax=Yeosuana marina TaxID=1565536 RepID=UPI0030C89F6C
MKSIFIKVLFLGCFLIFNITFGQEKSNCTVVDNESNGVYIGKCKKGLAHGDGVFEYMNGKYMYVGKFKKGKKHGEGKLFSFIEGEKKLVKEGVWKNNKYVGKKPESKQMAYKVQKRVNIDRYTVRNIGEGNKVKFTFLQNGNRNNIEDITIIGDSGTRFSNAYNQSTSEGFENVKFPFKCRVTYRTLSKLKFQTLDVRFEILIIEPGIWDITLNN